MINITHTVQKIIVNRDETLPDALFYRGDYQIEDGHITIPAQGTVTFDTYFNSFAASQWNTLTGIDSVCFCLKLTGAGTLKIWTSSKHKQGLSLVKRIPFDCSDGKLLETEYFPIENLGTYAYVQVTAGEEPVRVLSGNIVANAPAGREIDIACCFCTYKREKDIQRNVHNLLAGVSRTDSILNGHTDIYIADNGHTLNATDFDQGEHVFLFENKNYGGSSGFTRCLIESAIKKPGKYSHIILMDDDALIQDYVLERTAMLLSFLKPKYHDYMIGGALLSRQKPWLQAENGAVYTNRGTVLNGDKTDLRDFTAVIHNQDHAAGINYNAWFYACMPASFVTENNLPLPLFLHGDDIEYGLRFQNKIIRMNGICIWHPDPATSRRPYLQYYDHRNYSIIEAVNDSSMTARKYRYSEWKKILGLLSLYRYEDAWYAIWGCRDFLKGIDAFREIEPEELNRSILRWKQLEQCHIEDIDRQHLSNPEHWRKPSRIKRLANLVIPAGKTKRIYDSSVSWEAIRFFRANEICIVDAKTGDGVSLKNNPREARAVMEEFHKLEKEISAEYDRVAAEWRSRIGELRSFSFWETYLGLCANGQQKEKL